MKRLTNFSLHFLALHLVVFASAAPSTLTSDVQFLRSAAAQDALDITISPNAAPTHRSLYGPSTQTADEISETTLTTRGYDPSKNWHGWATVEIWTGGSSRAPINYGDTRGANLSDTIFALLNTACPPSMLVSGAGCCPGSPKQPTGWEPFSTNALVNGDPWWEVNLRQAWVRVEGGCFANEQTRIVLLQLAADTLRAYTRRAKGYNCYDVPGTWEGIYCNVPQRVRVNLPDGKVEGKRTWNYMYIETWSTDAMNQFGFTKGELRPCKTRKLVDEVMDKYENDLTKLFPEWKNWFKREAKVIIDGYKDCTDEP